MADILRRHAALPIPVFLERQRAKHVIDPLAHLRDAPAQPGPQLRRHEVENRDAVEMGPSRHPPVEPGIVDQHDCVGALMAKRAIGLGDQGHELRQHGEDTRQTHHRELRQWEEMPAPRRGHLVAAEADALHIGLKLAQAADEIGAVDVAAGFADAEEDAHGDVPVMVRNSASRAASAGPGYDAKAHANASAKRRRAHCLLCRFR